MGFRVRMTHDVDLTCDFIGCANHHHRTWVDNVADAINDARTRGWWIGSDTEVSSDAQHNTNKPTLAFCPDHIAEAIVYNKEDAHAPV